MDTPHLSFARSLDKQIHKVIDEYVDDESDSAPPSLFPSGFAFRLIYNGQALTWLVDSDSNNDEKALSCPPFSHLCDVSVLINRVTSFASRTNMGCGEGGETSPSSKTNGTLTGNLKEPAQDILSSAEQSAIDNPNLFLGVSMVSSFLLGIVLTCCSMCLCRRRPRTRQRYESELVFTTEEPDITID